MRLKASHWWTPTGDIVIEVRDHDNYTGGEHPIRNAYSRGVTRNPKALRVAIVARAKYPKGTSKKEVAMLKKTMIMAYEVRVNEVSK